MRLKDKVAVITGGSDPFALAIALGYAREGALIYLQDFEDRAEGLEKTASEVRAIGQKVVTGIHDITHLEPTKEMTAAVLQEFGHIDILVNTTEGGWHGFFFEATEADWDKAIDRGLKAYFMTCQQIGKEMARRGSGKIINLTSIVGKLGSGQAVLWGSARGGVDSLTAAVAQALGEYGVNCTGLARGATEITPYPKEAIAGRINRLTFRRLGRTSDAVGPAIFLATSDSDWVTGSVIYADGGYTTAAETDPEYRAKEVPYRGP